MSREPDLHARILADVQRRHGGDLRGGKLYPLRLVVDNPLDEEVSLDFGIGWFAVHTHPLAEFRVEEGLRKIGFQTFLPTMLRRISHGRKVIERTRALFPRYVFVGFNPKTQPWGPITDVDGVSRLLAVGEHPLQIPDRLITKIMVDDLLKVNYEFIDRNAVEQRRPRVRGKAHKSWKGRKERKRIREARKRTKGMSEWLQKANKGA